MGNLKDFDEFFKEMRKKEDFIEIKLYDKIYKISKELPAKTFLEIHRATKLGDKEFTDAKQMELAILMIGEENVSDWCEHGMTLIELGKIMEWVADEIKGSQREGGSESNAKK